MKKINPNVLIEIEKDMCNSTIPNEIAVMNIMATAIDLMNRHCMNRIKKCYSDRGLEAKDGGSVLKGLKMYCQKVREMNYWYERELEPNIIDCTFGSKGVRAYDNFHHSANELCQYTMLLFDRLITEERNERLRKMFEEMSTVNFFTQEDIDYFQLK